ncbi:MAG: late competence development ComFB family protein [Prevotella sp.]|nr:late competence development ComFB family protein [Prevotella sp.]
MAVVNVMESIVRERLEFLLQGHDCCKCDKCIDDMMALSLNELRPKYVNSHKGELFSRLDTTKYQNTIDIDVAITKAISMVSSKPQHK